MVKYHGYFLASVLAVWVVILGFLVRTWLLERRHSS